MPVVDVNSPLDFPLPLKIQYINRPIVTGGSTDDLTEKIFLIFGTGTLKSGKLPNQIITSSIISCVVIPALVGMWFGMSEKRCPKIQRRRIATKYPPCIRETPTQIVAVITRPKCCCVLKARSRSRLFAQWIRKSLVVIRWFLILLICFFQCLADFLGRRKLLVVLRESSHIDMSFIVVLLYVISITGVASRHTL